MAVSEHVSQLADLLRVLYRLVERNAEIVRAEYREVGVVGLEILVGVSVNYREIVVVVLLADEAAGILAECPYLILERQRVADELRLIENGVDLLHDLVAYLDAHADVNGSGLVSYAVAFAGALEPVRALSAGGSDDVVRPELAAVAALVVGDDNSGADVALNDDVLAAGLEHDVHAVLKQVLFNSQVELMSHFGAEVADRAVNQLEIGVDRLLAYLADLVRVAYAFYVWVCAEFKVDLVGVVDRGLSQLLADEFREVSADLAGERQFAVRERARTGESRGDVAVGLAVHADLRLSLRTGSFLNGNALLHDEHFLFRAFAEHFQCGKNTGGACAYDYNVIICHF